MDKVIYAWGIEIRHRYQILYKLSKPICTYIYWYTYLPPTQVPSMRGSVHALAQPPCVCRSE